MHVTVFLNGKKILLCLKYQVKTETNLKVYATEYHTYSAMLCFCMLS